MPSSPQSHHEGDPVSENEESSEDNVLLMGDSEMTDAERRALRKKQRNLFKEMEQKQNDKEEDENRKSIRIRNNALFKKVRYTREAVLDAENVQLIAHREAKKMERMVQVPRYDAKRLVHKLMQKCRSSTSTSSNAYFDWKALGMEAGVCFNAIPSGVCFLNGPLSDGQPVQVRQRRTPGPRVQTKEEPATEARPETVEGHTQRDADQLSAIEQSMKVISHTLKKKVDMQYRLNLRKLEEVYGEGNIPTPAKKKLKKHGVDVDGVKYLFNPKSFTQTVENIFHFSFLIKKGSAAISVREKTTLHDGMVGSSGLCVKYANEQKRQPTPKQSIVSFTMQDWRRLCQAYDVKKGELPHRTGSKQQKRRATTPASSQRT